MRPLMFSISALPAPILMNFPTLYAQMKNWAVQSPSSFPFIHVTIGQAHAIVHSI